MSYCDFIFEYCLPTFQKVHDATQKGLMGGGVENGIEEKDLSFPTHCPFCTTVSLH